MKKLLIAVLAAMIFFSVPTLAADLPVAGGWTVTEGETITPEAKALFCKALEGIVGAEYSPIALLSTQAVAGTNYCFLCRVTPVEQEAEASCALVYIYEDPEGNAELLEVKDIEFGLSALSGEENPDIGNAEEKSNEQRIGIISAMENEISLLLDNAQIDYVTTIGNEDFHVGTLCGQNVVITKSGVGKILSASGVTAMLNNFNISEVFFTGIAGGVGDDTQVLDIVVATDLVQHDYGQMTNNGFEWYEGYLNGGYFPCNEELVEQAYASASEIVGSEHVFKGTIATGDQFIASEEYVKTLQEDFNAIACEMEGASIALVCTQYAVPFVVIRSMSDKADGLAHETYEDMADKAADNSGRIIMSMLQKQTDSDVQG